MWRLQGCCGVMVCTGLYELLDANKADIVLRKYADIVQFDQFDAGVPPTPLEFSRH